MQMLGGRCVAVPQGQRDEADSHPQGQAPHGSDTGVGMPTPRSARLASYRPPHQNAAFPHEQEPAGAPAPGERQAERQPGAPVQRSGRSTMPHGRSTKGSGAASRHERRGRPSPNDAMPRRVQRGEAGSLRQESPGGVGPLRRREQRGDAGSPRGPESRGGRIPARERNHVPGRNGHASMRNAGRVPGRAVDPRRGPTGPYPPTANRAVRILGTIAMIAAALVGALGSAVSKLFGRLFGRRNPHAVFSSPSSRRRWSVGAPRSGRSTFARGSYRGSSWSRRGRRQPVRLRAVLAPSCIGALVLTLASTVFFVPSAGADAATEAKLLDLTPMSIGQLPASTQRSSWQQGSMPYLFQTDPLWAQKPYAGATVALNGCGPTCLTMVYIYLTGNTDLTPADMCARADAGGYAPTGATEWRFMTEMPSKLGFSSRELELTPNAISTALEAGQPVICAVAPGDFTSVGHFIVLSSIDEAGMLTVHDPNSSLRSAQKWSVDRILGQTTACWSFTA